MQSSRRPSSSSRPAKEGSEKAIAMAEKAAFDSMSENPTVRLHLDYMEPIEFGPSGADAREGDLIVDLEHPQKSPKAYPESFADFCIGVRLDAIDHKGQWYPGESIW
jgi:hypothetical protein